jgi:hypothetical protein
MSVQEARINNTAKYPKRRKCGGGLPVHVSFFHVLRLGPPSLALRQAPALMSGQTPVKIQDRKIRTRPFAISLQYRFIFHSCVGPRRRHEVRGVIIGGAALAFGIGWHHHLLEPKDAPHVLYRLKL